MPRSTEGAAGACGVVRPQRISGLPKAAPLSRARAGRLKKEGGKSREQDFDGQSLRAWQ